MLDRERILAKVDDLDRYMEELRQVLPESYIGASKNYLAECEEYAEVH